MTLEFPRLPLEPVDVRFVPSVRLDSCCAQRIVVTGHRIRCMVIFVIQDSDAATGGTQFFDEHKRFRGSATLVSRRSRTLSELAVIDVVGAEPGLAEFLSHLDKRRLILREQSGEDALFSFVWASGYVNGKDIRVQGVLERS